MSIQSTSKNPFNSVDDVLQYLTSISDSNGVESTQTVSLISNESETKRTNSKQSTKDENPSKIGQILPSGRVRYGPITINPRKQPAKTLFTGRRSKYEVLQGEEEIKRQKRREKNRAAATKCREKRESIFSALEQEFKRENERHENLMKLVENLTQRKAFLQEQIQQNSTKNTFSDGFIFGDDTFLSAIGQTQYLPLPQNATSTTNFNVVNQDFPLINSTFSTENNSNWNQTTTENDFNDLHSLLNLNSTTTNVSMESFHQNNSLLYNSAYGMTSGTCSQQHSGSSEEESLNSLQNRRFVY